MAASTWFAPKPSEWSASRLTLDFGLRGADQFYRELVVPELGRVWFVRQLTWPLAALELHAQMKAEGTAPKATAICHGIEALACKLEYWEHESERVLGTRAFGREEARDIWSFDKLRLRQNYVRNTHRAAATRAVRTDGGLGLASGQRFDLLEVEPVGRALANAFLTQSVGKGGTTLGSWLKRWIRDEVDGVGAGKTHQVAMSPEVPTNEERQIIRARLFDIASPNASKRKTLAAAIGLPKNPPDVDKLIARLRKVHPVQADEISAARAFGAMLDRCRDVVAHLTRVIEPARSGLGVAQLARDKDVAAAVAALKSAAGMFAERIEQTKSAVDSTAGALASSLIKGDTEACVRIIVGRASDLLALAGSLVVRGALFRVVSATEAVDGVEEGASTIEPDRTGRTFRIANLHSILLDIEPRESA